MPGIEDWLNKPLDHLQQIFEHSSPSECPQKVTEYFTKKLASLESFQKVPSLNNCPLHNLHSGSLVRFRCMIQDMFDPEFFLGAYEIVHMPSQKRYMRIGMYKDAVDCQKTEEVDMDSPRNKTMDRLTYYCVPVPGENEWVHKGYSQMRLPQTQPTSSTTPPREKRSLDLADDFNCEKSMDTNPEENSTCDSKRTKTGEMPSSNSAEADQTTTNTPQDLNFPLPDMEGLACLLKFYDHLTDLKVNDVIEVVGVLSADPTLTNVGFCSDKDALEMEMPDEMDIELEVHNPPFSLVPRIHVVMARKLEHINPHLPWNLSASENKHLVDVMLTRAPKIRSELHAVLSQALMGDGLAAEYLLCHLISSIYVRREVVALGKFSLNISNVPLHDDYNAQLHKLLQQIVTKSCYIPLTLENLNNYTFTPKKDYAKNRLVTGVLQLPVHIHMVLDETALSIGRLETKGVQNVTALGNLISWQRVDYDFSFHRMEYMTDVATLVLSEGKSLLPSDCRVPLQSVGTYGSPGSIFEAVRTYLTDSLLEEIRCYLTILKLIEYSMSESLQKLVQDDFVAMRRQDKSFSADDLHSLLVLARFLSLSVGEKSLSKESWEKAKSLEIERKQRLQTST